VEVQVTDPSKDMFEQITGRPYDPSDQIVGELRSVQNAISMNTKATQSTNAILGKICTMATICAVSVVGIAMLLFMRG
jgi:hypothetical protein